MNGASISRSVSVASQHWEKPMLINAAIVAKNYDLAVFAWLETFRRQCVIQIQNVPALPLSYDLGLNAVFVLHEKMNHHWG
jgi:hypothetical protein